MTETWYIAGNGKNDWHCPGHDFGESLSSPIRLAHIDPQGRNVVFQIPGGSHWTGVGSPRERHPAMYRVLEVSEGSDTRIVGRLVVEFPVIFRAAFRG